MKASEFEAKFEAGEDLAPNLDQSLARRPNRRQVADNLVPRADGGNAVRDADLTRQDGRAPVTSAGVRRTESGEMTEKPVSGAEKYARRMLSKAGEAAAQIAAAQENQLVFGTPAPPEYPKGNAVEAGSCIEVTLKHLVGFRRMLEGDPRTDEEITEEIKRTYGHSAGKLFRNVRPKDQDAVRRIYEECSAAHQEVVPRIGAERMATLDEALEWVEFTPNLRYEDDESHHPMPIGWCWIPKTDGKTVRLPNFPVKLVQWAEEQFEEMKPKRTRLEELKATYEDGQDQR